jgi:hypothetical protein
MWLVAGSLVMACGSFCDRRASDLVKKLRRFQNGDRFSSETATAQRVRDQ